MIRDSEVTKPNKVTEGILDRVNGKPSHRHCRTMAGEYICGLLIGSRQMQTEYPVEPTANTVGDSLGRWQVSICMEWDFEVTNLPKVAERILDRTSCKPCQRHCRAMASEHVCGLSIGCMLTVQSTIGNTRSNRRQTLREALLDDGN